MKINMAFQQKVGHTVEVQLQAQKVRNYFYIQEIS